MQDLRMGRAVARRYRNRRIGEFLKGLELSEGRDGIPKILSAMHANGSSTPRFETDEQRTSFLVRLPLRAGSGSNATGQLTGQVENVDKALILKGLKSLSENTGQVTGQVAQALLRFFSEPRTCQRDPISTWPSSSRNFQRQLP